MPMFPLGSVLVPGAVLPLHVFEQRYRALVRDCLATEDHEFGVTMIARGHEVGGGHARTDVGTVARMIQVAELADGRFALVCVGTRRIRVTRWLPDDPYPIAEVEDWPDEPAIGDLSAAVAAAGSRVRRVAALATELGDSCADGTTEVSEDPLTASYQFTVMAPIGPADTYRLLCADGPAARLAILGDVLDDVEAVLAFRMANDAQELTLGDEGDATG